MFLPPLSTKNMESNDLRYIKGIGPVRASSLKRIGLTTPEQLLLFFPKWHVHKTAITPIALAKNGQKTFIKGFISEVEELRRPGRSILKVIVDDNSGATLTWTWFNRPYMRDVLTAGRQVVIHDAVESARWGLQINGTAGTYEFLSPEENAAIERGEILGFYKSTKILTQEFFREIIRELINTKLTLIVEMLSPDITMRHDLYRIREALIKFHFPENTVELEKARRRLVFDELFMLQLFLARRKLFLAKKIKTRSYTEESPSALELEKKLPFELTGAQKRSIAEINADLMKKAPMNRLLQGDVGSGKTIVALMAMLKVIDSGYQAAIMAPTEILAEQHYRNYGKYFEQIGGGKKAVLLTGSLTAKQKREALAAVKSGEAALIVGTHALIQDAVEFKELGMIVIDERHKFGVFQRLTLESKGVFPDCLMMTATPFPRALVLTLYGDTELSVIDELPKGRLPIYTKWTQEKRRHDVYEFIRNKVAAGEQAFIVYPLVEESEKLMLKAAETDYVYLKNEVFKGRNVGLIHGRMSGEEKETAMREFKEKKIDILVATTVIEVGIDVSNATVMVIEHTERFGLAQLHQLRGRVGRGAKKSFCFLLTSWNVTSDAFKRLKIMEKTNDGFEVAEADLEIRGPGELFGASQHGELDLKYMDISRDREILISARQEAFRIIDADPKLAAEENIKIRLFFDKRFSKDMELITVS